MRWRWDQGRLDYFKFDNIRKIASALIELKGVDLSKGDPLRERLEAMTGLPFLPRHYAVWRNYGRTFQCALLAAKIKSRLKTTDVCSRLASKEDDAMESDEYFTLLIQRFYLPFPAFSDYSGGSSKRYPLCAAMRYLLAKAESVEEASVTLEEIFSHVIGNDCVGDESLDYYSRLSPTSRTPQGDEHRQVREMLIVLSQFSYLEWSKNTLEFDMTSEERETIKLFEKQFRPPAKSASGSKENRILGLGYLDDAHVIAVPERETDADAEFTEGRKARRTHLRVERNRKLRRKFFQRIAPPYQCDVCGKFINEHYPWVDNLLQIHHILPLASPMRIESSGTSFSDIKAICPNCHDAVHRFYKDWLSRRSQSDFSSDDEALMVYGEAKRTYVPE